MCIQVCVFRQNKCQLVGGTHTQAELQCTCATALLVNCVLETIISVVEGSMLRSWLGIEWVAVLLAVAYIAVTWLCVGVHTLFHWCAHYVPGYDCHPVVGLQQVQSEKSGSVG